MAEFKQNEIYFGFRLQKIEEINDIHSTAYLFSHEKSGARLLYLKNADHNKVFNVVFKTPPENDCGTPHILEHSVLCGSRKYEAKDPFNELAKGSLNTFLNAMTYADKTMYPVASCNEKDFHNLMDVYLDAVFFPKIYEKKEIFRQEGWRYLLNEEKNTLDVTGVVYNEMKGALSDPESLLSGAISRSIFGKTTYGYESGGLPAAIPDLTYESFLNFHRKYYHPSNAYFYLYGDMEPMACLQHISEDYLDGFEKSDALPVITETECVQKGKLLHETYPAAAEGEEGGSFLAYSIKAGKCTDPERVMALQILSYILLETNASPLKTALLDAGICQETEGWFDSSTYEMVFSIIAKNADVKQADAFIRIIDAEWKRLAAEGLPVDLVKGALRKFDFLLREEDYGSTPKGLIYATRLMKRWLHGEDPCDSLRLLSVIERLKKDEGYFERLLTEVFLHNEEKTYLVFTPEKGKAQKDAQAFAEKMAERRSAMTDADLAEIKEDAEKLEQFQTKADTPEILAQIPLLEISEIDKKPQPAPYNADTAAKFLHVPLESNGILYLKLMFDISAVPQELLPYTGLLTELLGKLDTEKYSFQTLATVKNQIFGDFSLHNNTYNSHAADYRAFVTVKEKLLKEDLDAAIAMTEEIFFHTKYDVVESMKKIVKSAKIKGENELLNQSHYFAIFYGGSNLFPALRIEDITSGIRYYRFLCEIDAQLEQDAAPVIAKLKKTADLLFTQRNLEVALGCEESERAVVQTKIDTFRQKLPAKEQKHFVYNFDLKPERAAFANAGGVLYNTTSFDYQKNGLAYHGKYQVLKTIINLEYLWNQVRVQGGAYGCGCQFMRSGFSYFYSYRDPRLTETYDIFKGLAQQIEHFDADKREMIKYILGTINTLDQPKTNMEQLNHAIGRFYKQLTDADFLQERTEILQTTAADIRDCADLLRCVDCENVCSIGKEQKIKENENQFTRIESLI